MLLRCRVKAFSWFFTDVTMLPRISWSWLSAWTTSGFDSLEEATRRLRSISRVLNWLMVLLRPTSLMPMLAGIRIRPASIWLMYSLMMLSSSICTSMALSCSSYLASAERVICDCEATSTTVLLRR